MVLKKSEGSSPRRDSGVLVELDEFMLYELAME
jgi:hypothetical protein